MLACRPQHFSHLRCVDLNAPVKNASLEDKSVAVKCYTSSRITTVPPYPSATLHPYQIPTPNPWRTQRLACGVYLFSHSYKGLSGILLAYAEHEGQH